MGIFLAIMIPLIVFALCAAYVADRHGRPRRGGRHRR